MSQIDKNANAQKPQQPGKKVNSRSAARLVAMQALYQWLQADTEAQDLLLQFQRAGLLKEVDTKYFRTLVTRVIEDEHALALEIEAFLDRGI